MKFVHILLLSCTLVFGCATPAPAPDGSRLNDSSAWADSALKLPADSPIVLEINPHRVFSALRRLKDWFVAEPENWGAEGPRMTRLAGLYWGLLSTYAGGDPAMASTWHGLGIDPAKPFYFGVYPMDPQTRSWFDEVERVHKQKQGFGQISASSGMPLLGFRVVIPIYQAQTLQNFVRDLTSTLNYQEIHWEHLGEGRTAYASAHADDPWLSWKIFGDELVADFVFLHHGTPEEGSQLIQRAIALKSGHPDAPRPPGDFDAAIGFHQLGVASIAKARGYVRAISAVQSVSAGERDAQFDTLVSQVQKHARAWEVRADRIPGLIYTLSSDTAKTELEMAFLLDPSVPDLRVPELERGLGISEQGLGLMIDMAILNDPAWKSVLSLENTDEALAIVGAGEDDSMLYAFSFPRSLALISGNIVDAAPAGFSELWSPLISALPSLRRLELSSPNVLDAQVALHATFRDDVRPDILQDSARALVLFLDRLRVRWAKGSSPWNVVGLEPEVLQPLATGGTDAFTQFSPSQRELLVGTGTKEIVESIQARVGQGGFKGADAIFIRVEPASLVTLLRHVSPELLPAIETGRIAQRTGPWIFRMGPDSKNASRMIRWRVEINPPPRLE